MCIEDYEEDLTFDDILEILEDRLALELYQEEDYKELNFDDQTRY